MKDKSETYMVFKRFHLMVKNVFQASIHILRSDNGREYFSNDFNNYLNEHDIVHQSSCPYNSQQNGVAERKNQHLLETARALMFTQLVPNSYWGEAVLTATYLINRLPSKLLNFKTPLSVFLEAFPHYSRALNNISPKVFGCTSFVHQNQINPSKLDPKAIKCVFVGYSPTQQGYKCYNPITRKFIISCDVSFLETKPFFHHSNSNEHQETNCSIIITVPINSLPGSTTSTTADQPTDLQPTNMPDLEVSPNKPTDTTGVNIQ